MKKNYKKIILGIIVLLVVGLTIGYAALSTTLTATGTTTIKGNTWNVRFASVTKLGGVDPIIAPTIDESDPSKGTQLSYSVKLNTPGEYYEFEAVVENRGTLAAKLNSAPILEGTHTVATQTVTYSDGNSIMPGDTIAPGENVKIKVRVEFLKDLTNETLPSIDSNVTYKVTLEYVQG